VVAEFGGVGGGNGDMVLGWCVVMATICGSDAVERRRKGK
jgi:hypothetical protein